MAANALINDSRLCSQNGRVMRPREEAIRAIQMIIIIIKVRKRFFPLLTLIAADLQSTALIIGVGGVTGSPRWGAICILANDNDSH